jgi:hypothetical protein
MRSIWWSVWGSSPMMRRSERVTASRWGGVWVCLNLSEAGASFQFSVCHVLSNCTDGSTRLPFIVGLIQFFLNRGRGSCVNGAWREHNQ